MTVLGAVGRSLFLIEYKGIIYQIDLENNDAVKDKDSFVFFKFGFFRPFNDSLTDEEMKKIKELMKTAEWRRKDIL